MQDNSELYKEEIEELTGKVFNGDLTPLIFDILKGSVFKEDLIEELTGEKFVVSKENEVVEIEPVLDFEEWFNQCKQLK